MKYLIPTLITVFSFQYQYAEAGTLERCKRNLKAKSSQNITGIYNSLRFNFLTGSVEAIGPIELDQTEGIPLFASRVGLALEEDQKILRWVSPWKTGSTGLSSPSIKKATLNSKGQLESIESHHSIFFRPERTNQEDFLLNGQMAVGIGPDTSLRNADPVLDESRLDKVVTRGFAPSYGKLEFEYDSSGVVESVVQKVVAHPPGISWESPPVGYYEASRIDIRRSEESTELYYSEPAQSEIFNSMTAVISVGKEEYERVLRKLNRPLTPIEGGDSEEFLRFIGELKESQRPEIMKSLEKRNEMTVEMLRQSFNEAGIREAAELELQKLGIPGDPFDVLVDSGYFSEYLIPLDESEKQRIAQEAAAAMMLNLEETYKKAKEFLDEKRYELLSQYVFKIHHDASLENGKPFLEYLQKVKKTSRDENDEVVSGSGVLHKSLYYEGDSNQGHILRVELRYGDSLNEDVVESNRFLVKFDPSAQEAAAAKVVGVADGSSSVGRYDFDEENVRKSLVRYFGHDGSLLQKGEWLNLNLEDPLFLSMKSNVLGAVIESAISGELIKSGGLQVEVMRHDRRENVNRLIESEKSGPRIYGGESNLAREMMVHSREFEIQEILVAMKGTIKEREASSVIRFIVDSGGKTPSREELTEAREWLQKQFPKIAQFRGRWSTKKGEWEQVLRSNYPQYIEVIPLKKPDVRNGLRLVE